MTSTEFRLWYEELPILTYGEIDDEQVQSAFKEILNWKSQEKFISEAGTSQYSIPKSDHDYTTTEYWLYLGLLSDCIDYGSSPRGAWLNDKGKEILDFMNNNTYPYYEEY